MGAFSASPFGLADRISRYAVSMAATAIQKIIDRGESARRALKRYREAARISERRMITAAEVIGAAAVAGAIDAKYGEGEEGASVLGVPAVPVIGGGLVLLGFSEAVPGGQDLAALGTGFVAGFVRDVVYRRMRT